MRYFTVEKEVMRATPVCYTVARDGSQLADEWETDWEQEITTGFAVHSYDEDGTHYNTEFYPVITDTEGWTDNSDKVLAQIEHDYPPTEYQNNEW